MTCSAPLLLRQVPEQHRLLDVGRRVLDCGVLPSIGGLPGGEYITIVDATRDDFENDIDDDYDPDNKTNWEDALCVGRYMAPRPDPEIPHLVVFITDGDPTAVIRNGQVTPIEYQTKVPLSDNEVSDASGNAGATPAISNANALKADGSHILAIGVGAALQNAQSWQRLISVSGPDVFSGIGTFDIATDDAYLEPNFAELEDALRDAAFQLCAPSVNIRKLYDATPDPDSLDDAIPGVGWEMTGTVDSVPVPGTLEWVLPNTAPAGIVGTPTTATSVTDAAGFVTFQWTPTNPNGTSTFHVTEDTPNNPPDLPGGTYSNVPSETACTFRTPDTPSIPIAVGEVDPNGGFTIDIPPESIVTCRIVNVATPAPGIDIEKFTNGADADSGHRADHRRRRRRHLGVPGDQYREHDTQQRGGLRLRSGHTSPAPAPPSASTIRSPALRPVLPLPGSTRTPPPSPQPIPTASTSLTATRRVISGRSWGSPSRRSTNGQDADEPFGPGINVGGTVTWTYQVSLVPATSRSRMWPWSTMPAPHSSRATTSSRPSPAATPGSSGCWSRRDLDLPGHWNRHRRSVRELRHRYRRPGRPERDDRHRQRPVALFRGGQRDLDREVHRWRGRRPDRRS